MTSFRSIAGVNYSNWEEVYSIDFSDHDSGGAMSDSDTIEIKGVTWTAASSSLGGSEIVAGTGLILSPQLNSIMWNEALTKAPFVFADMEDIVPNLSMKDVICMQWVHDYSASSGDQFPNDEFETVGGQIWNSDAGSGWYGIGVKGFAFQDDLTWAPWRGPDGAGAGEDNSDTDETKFRSFEVVWSFTGQTVIISSPSGSTTVLADPLVADYKRVYATGVYGTVNTWTADAAIESNTISNTNARAMLYAYTQAATVRGFKGIFTKG